MPVSLDICRLMELEQEVSPALSTEVPGVLLLAKSPVTSRSSDKCSDLLSLASFSSFIFSQRKPCPESTFLHNRLNSLFCVWVFYLRAQRVKLLNPAILCPTLLPAAHAKAPAYTSLAWTDPLPHEHHDSEDSSFPLAQCSFIFSVSPYKNLTVST